MIDRKAFWISGALIAAMLAAALWRVTQLADWTQLPHHGKLPFWITSSAWLLVAPGVVAVSMSLVTMRMRMVDASDGALLPWKKWAGFYLVTYSMIMALLQVFIIAGTLGLLPVVNPVLFFRGILVVFGLLLMVMSNTLPKLPWLPSRFWLAEPDPDKGAKLLRFRGRLGFLFGLVIVLVGLMVPLGLMRPAILSMVASWAVVWLFYRFGYKRGQIQ